jgi:hypothetical protein
MNAVHLIGTTGQYGVKITYTEHAKPQMCFTLIVAEGAYQRFILGVIVGNQAKEMAEILELGDVVLVKGRLRW